MDRRPPRRRPPVVVVATAALVLVLAALTATVTWSFHTVREQQGELESVTEVLLRYRQLQNAVADQAYAEAAYRRDPGAEARRDIDTAAVSVDVAVRQVRSVGARADGATLSYLLVLNRRYQAEVTRTLDRAAAPGTDDRVAGPALNAIRELLEAALDRRSEERETVVADQQVVLDRLTWLLPAALAAAVAALVLAWVALTRAHRRLARRAADSEHRAGHDPLTGLANRTVFAATLERSLTEQDRTAVMLVDLDHFKAVNDTWGHPAGDALLVAVARALVEATRSTDLVARLGGDEFALVVRPSRAPEVVADKILLALAGLTAPDGNPVSASIGLSVSGPGCATADELLTAADAALYRAKAAGRGRAAFAGT